MNSVGLEHLHRTWFPRMSPELPADISVMDPMVHIEVTPGTDPTDETSRHPIGSVSMMRELRLGLGDRGVTPDPAVDELLARLSNATGAQRVDVSTDLLDLLESTVSAFARSIRGADTEALALIDASPTVDRVGLLRGWPHRLTGRLLARHGAVTVGIAEGGLGVWFADHRREPIVDLRVFQLGVEGAVVTDGAGTVHIVDAEATRALGAVASESTRWRVRRVPEVLVWATAIAGIESGAAAARDAGVGATVVVG